MICGMQSDAQSLAATGQIDRFAHEVQWDIRFAVQLPTYNSFGKREGELGDLCFRLNTPLLVRFFDLFDQRMQSGSGGSAVFLSLRGGVLVSASQARRDGQIWRCGSVR